MTMADKKQPRFPTKFIADVYHYLIEEESDKKDYKLDHTTYDKVWTTYYDCYIIVHCKYGNKKNRVTFARKGSQELVYVACKWTDCDE